MATFVDPSTLTPLFTAQQVTCAYPISDLYASLPRYLYYALLVGCILIRWHPWLSDAFLGAAATYAGVAAIESFVLLAGYPKPTTMEQINIPYVNAASVTGNTTLEKLVNLVTDSSTLTVWPAVLEYDIDAILAIVVTSYLFMLPVHCFSTHVRGNRARHLLMGLWNILMLAATVCGLIMWLRIDDVPFQYRFCYPQYPDQDSVTNDGWQTNLWAGSWNSTIWNTFQSPDLQNQLTENCIYPCFNTSQILRRPQSIVATVKTNDSPRTSNSITTTDIVTQGRLAYFMYVAVIFSGCTAIVVLLLTLTGMNQHTTIPLHQPLLLWTDRNKIKQVFVKDIKNLIHRTKKKKKLPRTEKEAVAVSVVGEEPRLKRRKSTIRLIANIIALVILFVVVVIIPATWIVFVIWIEYWIHSDLVSSETPAQVGQWGGAASVALILISALVLRLKYRLASREEITREIDELKARVRKLEGLRERKLK